MENKQQKPAESKDDTKDRLVQDATDIANLLGYGEVFEVFIGLDENQQPKSKLFHISPVSLKDVPELMKKIEVFQEIEKKSSEKDGFAVMSEKEIKTSAELIKMGLSKTQPDISVEEILKVFTLDSLLQAVRAIVGVNQLAGNPTTPVRRQMQMAPPATKNKTA